MVWERRGSFGRRVAEKVGEERRSEELTSLLEVPSIIFLRRVDDVEAMVLDKVGGPPAR